MSGIPGNIRVAQTGLRMLRIALAAGLLAGALGAWPDTVAAQSGEPFLTAPSLRVPDSRTTAPDGEGFLRRWLVLEPIAVDGRLTDGAVRETVAANALPEMRRDVPADGESVTLGAASLTWHAVDTTGYNLNLFHFARALGRPTSNVLFWVVTVVDSPAEMRDVRLAIGSNAASIWWVNGEQVIDIYNDRQTVIDDGVSDRLTLRRGPNVILAAIINAGGATDFCARLLDANNDPIESLAVDLGAVTRR